MSLQTRVVAILTKPADEWCTIAAGPATVEVLIRDYAAPLAANPALSVAHTEESSRRTIAPRAARVRLAANIVVALRERSRGGL